MTNLTHLFASRFMRTRKRNGLLSFLSIISVVGIMLGVATLITVISVMDGFTENLKTKFMGATANIIVNRMDRQPIPDSDKLIADIEAMPHITGAAPAIIRQGMISSERTVVGLEVYGVDPVAQDRVMKLSEQIVRGEYSDLNNGAGHGLPGILLGRELMYILGVVEGKEVTLISPNGARGAFGIVPKMRKFRVAGFIDTGIGKVNETIAYVTMEDAAELFRAEGVEFSNVMVDNPDNSIALAGDVDRLLNINPEFADYWVRDWLSMNMELLDALRLEQYALFIILTMIVVVASFNIVSMISVTVKDKRRDIAILRTMGASESFIGKVFVRQGLIIGTAGTVLGNLLALVIAFVLTHYKIIEINEDIYMSSTIPIKLSLSIFVITTICSLAITYLASIIPSRLSARIDPIEALRND
jgi:lipoprotein-releasing system permease protein